MSAVSAVADPRHLLRADGRARWHRRVVGSADVAGSLVWVMPVLLGASAETGAVAPQFVMYGLCLLAVLPHVGPFVASLPRNASNLLFVLLFGALALSMAAAFVSDPTPDATLQAKALAATAVWASIYIVVFAYVRTTDGVLRFMQWTNGACLVLTASVYLSALGHAVGLGFGEVLEYRDGSIRAFGPLGDQVSFVLVLPVLTALVASRPLMFGLHFGALALTATRGAFLCFVLGLIAHLVLLALEGARSRGRMVRSLLAAAVVGGLVWLSPVASVMTARLLLPSDESGYTLRLAAIESGTRVFRDNPFLGVGFNGFESARPAIAEDWLAPDVTEGGLSRTANQYVQTATDGGVLALLALVLFVICTARSALRVARWRDASPELAASQLWLVSVFAGNLGALWLLSSAATGFYIFAVAGLTARVSAIARERPASAPPPAVPGHQP